MGHGDSSLESQVELTEKFLKKLDPEQRV